MAQKHIKHFVRLGVDSLIIADIMLYNIEIAQTYSKDHTLKAESFYKSMFTSFSDATTYINDNGLLKIFSERLTQIVENSIDQNWFNYSAFERILEENC